MIYMYDTKEYLFVEYYDAYRYCMCDRLMKLKLRNYLNNSSLQ